MGLWSVWGVCVGVPVCVLVSVCVVWVSVCVCELPGSLSLSLSQSLDLSLRKNGPHEAKLVQSLLLACFAKQGDRREGTNACDSILNASRVQSSQRTFASKT